MITSYESSNEYKSGGGRYFIRTYCYIVGSSTTIQKFVVSYDGFYTEKLYKGNNLDGTGAFGSGGSSGPVACFVGDTKVLMADNTLKNIKDIKNGDLVKSIENNLGIRDNKSINGIVKHDTDEIYNIDIGENIIKATWSHPFNVIRNNKGYKVLVKDMKSGDKLETFDNRLIEIKSINKVKEKHTVYEIRVSDFNTYYVGNSSVLVFNEDSVI